MLIESTGIAMCDSGGGEGRHWQQNQKKSFKDFENEAEIKFDLEFYPYTLKKDNEFIRRAKTENELLEYLQKTVSYSWEHAFKHEGYKIQKDEYNSKDINYTVSLFHYLPRVLELDDLCLEFNRKKVKDWDGGTYGVSKAGEKWLKAHGFEYGQEWNSYNGENTLSQIMQGTNLTEGGSEGDYILLQIHNGADVRGGYTNAKLVKLTRFQEFINPCPNVGGEVNGISVDSGYDGYNLTNEDGEGVPLKLDGTDVVSLSLNE